MKEYEYFSLLKPEIQKYLILRESQGYTIRKDEQILEHIDKYLFNCHLTDKIITPSITDGWVKSLDGLNSGTVKRYISTFRSFANYLNTLKIEAFAPENPIINDSYIPYVFSANEIERLFGVVDNAKLSRFKRSNLQFPILLRILYGTGMRLGEVLPLRVSDIDLSNGVIIVRNGKGKKDRFVPVDETLANIITRYCKLINEYHKTELLFGNNKGKPLSKTWAEKMFDRALKEAEIEKLNLPRFARNICPHCLRHTFIVNSFRKQDLVGADSYGLSPSLSAYVGHDKLTDTQKYMHMTNENSTDIYYTMKNQAKTIFPEVPK